jgi:CRP-like cAMP-binding protein
MPEKRSIPINRNAKSPKAFKTSRFDARAVLASAGARHYLESNQTIFRQGDTAGAIFYINKGKVQLTIVSEQGKERVIAMLQDGDFFGEGCLVGQSLYLVSAITTTESDLVRFGKKTMVRMLHEDHIFSEMFLAFLLSRNCQIEADLVDHLFNSSEKRLARTLLTLADFGKDGKVELVVPKMNQEALAARVGTTRSRINFFMNKFRRMGMIEYSAGLHGLKVHSSLIDIIVRD